MFVSAPLQVMQQKLRQACADKTPADHKICTVPVGNHLLLVPVIVFPEKKKKHSLKSKQNANLTHYECATSVQNIIVQTGTREQSTTASWRGYEHFVLVNQCAFIQKSNIGALLEFRHSREDVYLYSL